jgi:hypothetical protein
MDEQLAPDLLLIGVRQSCDRFDGLFQKIDHVIDRTMLDPTRELRHGPGFSRRLLARKEKNIAGRELLDAVEIAAEAL